MKPVRALTLASVAILLVGCGQSNPPSSPPSTTTPATTVPGLTNTREVVTAAAANVTSNTQPNQPTVLSATANVATNQGQSAGQIIEQYGHTLATARQKALLKTSFMSVHQAIQAYEASKGEHPSSLDDLIKDGILPRLPELPKGKRYNYNAQTGQLAIVDSSGTVFTADDLK